MALAPLRAMAQFRWHEARSASSKGVEETHGPSQEVRAAAFKEAYALYGELAASNPAFTTFYDSFLPYWKKEQLWFRVAELPFDAFNAQMSQQMR